MLDVGVAASAHGAPDLGSGHLAGQQTVLGEVLKVAAAEGRAVGVSAGAVEAGDAVGQCLVAQSKCGR